MARYKRLFRTKKDVRQKCHYYRLWSILTNEKGIRLLFLTRSREANPYHLRGRPAILEMSTRKAHTLN